jgi:transcriptional regulator with XRE-family HTH domain
MGAMPDSSPVRHHSTPAQREKILQACQRSQLTQKEFARAVGIGVSTLAAWLRKEAVKGEGGSSFVAVPNLLPALSTGPSFCLQWRGGLSLEIHPGFSSAELATLLQRLPKP